MGLDMFAYKVPKGKIKKEVDFSLKESSGQEELHYWRKHPNLHGWMEELYRSKGGTSDSFNGDNVQLTEEDLDSLESAIQKRNLPTTGGFFFGQSDGSEKDDDLSFVNEAREAIGHGYDVYYSSWW